MGRPVHTDLAQLIRRFIGHRAVALHDPCGDLLIALPGRVLHHHAVRCLSGFRSRHADTLIVVDLFDGDFGAFLGNVFIPGLAAALGHMDHGFLSQLIGGPCHTPAMVAVGGGEEGGLTELLAEGFTGQVIIGHLADVTVHLLGNVLRHGEGAAQHLECIQSEAIGLVLYKKSAQAQIFGHTVQPG